MDTLDGDNDVVELIPYLEDDVMQEGVSPMGRGTKFCSDSFCKAYCLSRRYRRGKCKSRTSMTCKCSKRFL